MEPPQQKLSRKTVLALFGGTAAAIAAARMGVSADEVEAAAGGPAGVASGAVSCLLTPELSEGPFYVPGVKVRRNITQGRPGLPLTLRATVVDASTCRPIKNAAVDIWHCDALGVYSGVEGNNGTFMRGIQRTNAHGLALFKTVYPGWYQGRAVHIHVKVHVGGNVVHTGQLFFPDKTTDAVYKRTPYSRRGARDTRNAADAIYRNGGSKSVVKLHKVANGHAGAITMGVRRS
jgi:protocatechuate 3,4-dioxygenase beta subunit